MLRVTQLSGFNIAAGGTAAGQYIDVDTFYRPEISPWQTTFAAVLTNNASSGWATYTLRQTINSSLLTTSGGLVRLVMPISPTGDFTIDALYIGEQASSGDSYDMKTIPAPAQFLVNGATEFTGVRGGTNVITDPLSFAIDEAKSYVISAHFKTMAGQSGTIWNATGITGANVYTKAPANEAGIADVTGYTNSGVGVALVEKIQVIPNTLRWFDTTAAVAFTQDIRRTDQTLRQIIPASSFIYNGTYVRLWLEAASNEAVTIDAIYIGEKAPTGDPYDMVASPAPAQIKSNGSTTFTISTGSMLVTDTLPFSFNATKSYVISYHIVSGSVRCTSLYPNSPDSPVSYDKFGNDAATANASGYTVTGLYQLFIGKVQVAADGIYPLWLIDPDVFYLASEAGGWHNAFTANLTSAQALAVGTARQVIHFADVIRNGTTLRLALQAGTGSVTIGAMWFGEQDTAGDAYDMRASSPAPVQLFVGGSASFSVAAGQTVFTDSVSFPLDETRSYVVSYFASAGGNIATGVLQWNNATAHYFKSTVNEAATVNVTGYGSSGGNVVRFIRNIQVL